MKKYTQPSIDVIDMEVRNVICLSNGETDGGDEESVETDPNKQAESGVNAARRRNAWAEYEGR
jgi:hypothetical protein